MISRTEAGEDITARAVRARKDLADVLERIREARIELIRADTREERLVIKSRIGSLEATADALETELNGVQRQGRFATVERRGHLERPGLRRTATGASATRSTTPAGVLEVIGGIALVSLAVLVPLALVAALAWLIATRIRRRRRERALDADPSAAATPSYGSKSALRAPQTGQNQVSGISLEGGPGRDAAVGIAVVGVVDEPARGADPELLGSVSVVTAAAGYRPA